MEACHPRNKFTVDLYMYRLLSQLLYFPTWKLFSRFALSFVTNNSSRLLEGKQLSGVVISRLYLKKKGLSMCLEKEIVNESYPIKGIISIYFNCKRILQSVFKLRGNKILEKGIYDYDRKIKSIYFMIDIRLSKIAKNNYCLFSFYSKSFNL